jgi:hypothetical protein
MDDTIQIEGTAVRLYRRGQDGAQVLSREAKVGDLVRALRGRRPLPLLPPGTRWARQAGTALAIAVEHPPQVRALRWTGEAKVRHLAFPFLVYVLIYDHDSLETMHVFFRPRPLGSEADPLYVPALLNVQATRTTAAYCRACLRGHPEWVEQPMGAQAERALEFFWSSGFDLDVADNTHVRFAGCDPRLASPETWEAATRHNPLFPTEVSWPLAHPHLAEAVDGLLTLRSRGARSPEDVSDLADALIRLPEAP